MGGARGEVERGRRLGGQEGAGVGPLGASLLRRSRVASTFQATSADSGLENKAAP